MSRRPCADVPSRAARGSSAARTLVVLAAALAAALAAGCSLLPGPAPAPRVYRVPVSDGPAADAGAPVSRLRVRTLTPAAHLDEGIAWRSGVQLGVRPGVRWAERPEVVLQHALLAQLFADGRLVRTESLDAPLLDVDLLAFEELLDDDGRGLALIELHARVLNEARDEVLSIGLEVRQPIDAGSDSVEALARALGAGLDDVCLRLAAEIEQTLAR